MTKQIELKRAEPAVPKEIAELFGKRHLVIGETPELYDALSSRIASAVHPEDIIELFWVKDITDLLWEIQRLRRFKAAIVNNGQKPALKALAPLVIDGGQPSRGSFIARLHAAVDERNPGRGKTKEELQALLQKNGFDDDSVAAESFRQNVEVLETIDRLLTAAEFRRDRVLREIEFHRETLGQRMRAVVDAEGKKPALLESTKKDTGSSVHN